jgi:pimeloyl-ACP methyl ester carboxylesterase
MPDGLPAHRAWRTLAGLALLLFAACHPVPLATVPMRTVRYDRPGSDRRCLVVFLHGRDDRPEDFARHGFLARLEERGARCDAVAADTHMGYFVDRSVGRRLEEDVVAPARAAGYREIWLVGISLGGLAALVHEREHPGEVAGMVLIAPYLGEGAPIDEIAAAGGVARWTPPETFAADDFVRPLWVYLKAAYAAPLKAAYATPGARPRTPLYLGLGRSDRFGAAQRLLADLLPPERVTTVPGGHRWGPWEELWRRFLDRGLLPGTTPRDGTVPPLRRGERR